MLNSHAIIVLFLKLKGESRFVVYLSVQWNLSSFILKRLSCLVNLSGVWASLSGSCLFCNKCSSMLATSFNLTAPPCNSCEPISSKRKVIDGEFKTQLHYPQYDEREMYIVLSHPSRFILFPFLLRP